MYDNYTLILELDIKNLDTKIREFIEAHDNEIEATLLREKYLLGKQSINLRDLAKLHKCSMKKIGESMEKAERKLYSYLLKLL